MSQSPPPGGRPGSRAAVNRSTSDVVSQHAHPTASEPTPLTDTPRLRPRTNRVTKAPPAQARRGAAVHSQAGQGNTLPRTAHPGTQQTARDLSVPQVNQANLPGYGVIHPQSGMSNMSPRAVPRSAVEYIIPLPGQSDSGRPLMAHGDTWEKPWSPSHYPIEKAIHQGKFSHWLSSGYSRISLTSKPQTSPPKNKCRTSGNGRNIVKLMCL
jgi:hypothetical protein